MEISELLKKRDALQAELWSTINPICQRFRDETGICIDRIDIPVLDISKYSSPNPNQFTLGRITVKLCLDL